MKNFAILFLLIALVVSCSKETVKTSGQVTADQINSALSGTSVTQAWVYEWNGTYYASTFSNALNVTFKISGQFIFITVGYADSSSYKYYYNLDDLTKFNISNGYLNLYFK